MAVKQNIWDWTWFTWLADNNYISQKWHFANWSFNLDTQTEPWWVKLTPEFDERFTCEWKPLQILNVADFWKTWVYVFDDEWKIYKDWVKIFTLESWDDILWASAWFDESDNFYIYIFTRSKIHRMDQADPVWVDENWKSFHDDNSTKKYPLNIYWDIYFSSENYFYRLDRVWSQTVHTTYEFSPNDEVVWITFFQDNFNIYTSNWWQGRQYIFPILSETPYYNIEWNWLPILWATNLWATDYVITWHSDNYSDLYIVSWTQRQLLKANTEWKWRKFSWLLHSRLDDIYLVWKYPNNSDHYLYKYSNYFPWFKEELTPYLGNLPSWIMCIDSSSTAMYCWCSNDKVYKIDLNTSPANYNTSWELISMMMDFWTPESKKSLKEIHIVYDNKSTLSSDRWWNITIYARKSEDDSWIAIKSTWSNYDTWVTKMYAAELAAVWFGDFYQLQLKAVLEWAWTTRTPFLKKVRVIYQDNLQA